MNILITGASKGIGYETARLFAQNIENNVIAISRDAERLEKLKIECAKENSNSKLYPIPFDILSIGANKILIKEKVLGLIPHIDILINNAGCLVNKTFSNLTQDDILQMATVNFTGPTKLLQIFLPYMKKGSHIVNIGSMGGFQGSAKFAGLSVYSATKAALANLTECLAEEYKDQGISFNCLALGAVNTEMLANAFPGFDAPVSAQEMAKNIMHFAVNGNKFYNGKVIPVSLSTP